MFRLLGFISTGGQLTMEFKQHGASTLKSDSPITLWKVLWIVGVYGEYSPDGNRGGTQL
jgi:hypothetical protein